MADPEPRQVVGDGGGFGEPEPGMQLEPVRRDRAGPAQAARGPLRHAAELA